MTDKGTRLISGPTVHPLVRLLSLQLVLSLVLGAVFWGISGRVSGYSALLGGLCCVLPNAYLALRLAMPRRDAGARALLNAAYIGEFGKLALTLLMFGVIFALVRPLAPLPFFAGLIACQLATLAGLLMKDKSQTVRTDTKHGE